MKRRCHSPNASDYRHYGARGISVCDEWRNDFSAFLRDMGERPEGTTLDRINVNGNYDPSNCRWATASEQARNRRPRKIVQFEGEEWTVDSLSAHLGIDKECLVSRLKRHWPESRWREPPQERIRGHG